MNFIVFHTTILSLKLWERLESKRELHSMMYTDRNVIMAERAIFWFKLHLTLLFLLNPSHAFNIVLWKCHDNSYGF